MLFMPIHTAKGLIKMLKENFIPIFKKEFYKNKEKYDSSELGYIICYIEAFSEDKYNLEKFIDKIKEQINSGKSEIRIFNKVYKICFSINQLNTDILFVDLYNKFLK